jgi:hypothetical protein
MKNQRQLTHDEFEAIRPRLVRMSQNNVDAAYHVLVKGESQTTTGKLYGVTQQSIGDAVNAVWRHFLKDCKEKSGVEIPPDWVRVSATLPPEMAQVVTQMERSAMDKLSKDNR